MDLDDEDSFSKDPRQQKRVRSRDVDLELGALERDPDQRQNGSSKRASLLEQIRKKLCDYDKMLLKARQLAELQRPTDRDYINIRRWFWNEKPLAYQLEEEYILRKGDLITLKPDGEWGHFDTWIFQRIKQLDTWMPNPFTKV